MIRAFDGETSDSLLEVRLSRMSRSKSNLANFRNGIRSVSQLSRISVMLAITIVLSSCVSSVVSQIAPSEDWVPESSRVLLMPADARIHILTAGGTVEERADWTQQSRAHLMAALREELSARGVETVQYEEFGAVIPWDPDHAPMIRLYDVVGTAIRGAYQLPTKRGLRTQTNDLDYSLGGTVLDLGDSYSAGYALLLHVDARYASGGRWAVAVLAAAGGVSMPTDSLYAHASLVDLNDGKIIWFGLVAGSIDAREQSGARTLVEGVLEELPI